MKSVAIALIVASLSAGTLAAQSIPPVARTKLAATHAVNQTNAHTKAMTNIGDSVTIPSPSAQVEAPDSSRSTQQVDSAAGSTAAASASGGFEREVFYYERNGRRDPFASLMTSSELRPLISDIRLVAVAYDAAGRNSVAVLRDVNTKDQYRVRIGSTLGRMRVSAINPKFVTFTIEEFGFSRQELLALGDSNKGSSK